MLGLISRVWDINDPLPNHVDVIALISYAATDKELTNGSFHTRNLTRILHASYPRAKIIFGVFSKNSTHGKEVERQKVFFSSNAECVGDVSSSTDECEAILKEAAGAKSIIVVAEG